MTLTGYDSTRPGLIPAGAECFFYYCDGNFRWSDESIARFPHAKRRAITVLGNPTANIADVEKGNMTPEDVPGFLRGWREHHPDGYPGTVYCSRSTLVQVQLWCKGMEFGVWLATLDGSIPTHITGGGTLLAVQYEGGPTAPYDVTRVLDEDWPHHI